MTSLACVAAGRLMLSDVALLAVPLLALTAPRNPMMKAPGQVSSTSHSFVAVRHTVLADRKPLAGQAVLVPVHVSATSHGPATARHVAPAFPAGCWQASFVPSH